MLIVAGRAQSPFDDASVAVIKRFIASVVGKIHKLRTANSEAT